MLSRSIFIVGTALTLLGLIMIPLPGPGFLLVGLGVLVLLLALWCQRLIEAAGKAPNSHSVSGMQIR